MRNKSRKNKGGRPLKITKEVLQKLEDAFSNAFPDAEACLYAGISPGTLYNYQLKHPEFLERKETLKLSPNLVARKTIVGALSDVNQAWKWIEKKDPEMRPITKVEHSGKIQTEDLTPKDPAVIEAIKVYNETRRKQIADEAKAMP